MICGRVGGTLLLSVIYFYFPKYGGLYWFTGPVRTLEDEDSISTAQDDMKEEVSST